MSMIGADNLSLMVGDGGGPEVFTSLKGAAITRLEITQKNNVTNALASDAWQQSAGGTSRRAVVECEALVTDDASTIRVRSLALNGAVGNFKLELSTAETLIFSAVVTGYNEMIDAGEIKRLRCRLESSGTVTIA